MLLSTIFKDIASDASAAAALIELDDLVLIGNVEAVRLEHHESVGEYVIGAARRFSVHASESDWLRLTTELEGSSAPAAACLRTILAWAVSQDRSADAEGGQCTCQDHGQARVG